MRLAVCDDERIELDQIAAMIQAYYASDCEIKKYEDAESLLADSRKQVFDVLFLDIDMPGMDGMQLAGRIREDNEYVKIIFVTNKEDCVFKGYKYDAFRFVRKSALNEELTEALDDLSRYFEAKKEYVVFKTPNDEITRYIDRIQYLEVRDHELTIKYDDIMIIMSVIFIYAIVGGIVCLLINLTIKSKQEKYIQFKCDLQSVVDFNRCDRL